MIQTTSSQFPGQIEVLPGPEALAAAQSLSGLAIWSDGSRLENGRCGAGIAWQEPGGTWNTRGIPLGKGHEVFDAELFGVVQAFQVAWKVGDQRPVTILLDSQAAIARLRHTQPGPGQALAIQAHAIAKGLHVTIQWVPGHAGVEGNERADQVAKQTAGKPSGRVQKRSLWPLPVEPEQKLLQHRSRDGSLGSSAGDPNKVNEYTGRRKTGGSTKQLCSMCWQQQLTPLSLV